ncbi:hypothetical protein DY000_02047845 [Brassica cretica]|uniref:Uncharacterized protein n=1 Tax=Brassica cretica TaxID=69181 RepID=A0ABQ7EW26_BRACR|nr:hypothetical protein DY000_02047845 [Brassica cretica]
MSSTFANSTLASINCAYSSALLLLLNVSSSSHYQSSSADGRAGRVFDPARPSGSADDRAGRVFDPARPSAELVTCSIQLGHPPNWASPARRMVELVGHLPSWNGSARRMAELVVLVDPDRPSTELKANSKIYIVSKDGLNQTMGRSSSIAKHLTCLCSSAPQKIEAIQREIVEIQGYIARRPEASASIDIRNNKSTDNHRRASVDEATNRGRLVPKVTSDMSDTHNHG